MVFPFSWFRVKSNGLQPFCEMCPKLGNAIKLRKSYIKQKKSISPCRAIKQRNSIARGNRSRKCPPQLCRKVFSGKQPFQVSECPAQKSTAGKDSVGEIKALFLFCRFGDKLSHSRARLGQS